MTLVFLVQDHCSLAVVWVPLTDLVQPCSENVCAYFSIRGDESCSLVRDLLVSMWLLT